MAAAQAQVAALKAQQVLQGANVAAAMMRCCSATAANHGQNTRDEARQKRLFETGSASPETAEKIQTTREQLSAQLAQNRAQIDAASRQIAVLAAQQAQAEAAVAGAQAALQTARINLAYTRIIAPVDGVIGSKTDPAGPVRGRGRPDHHPDAPAACVGHRQLQGDPADPHGGGGGGADPGGYLSRPCDERPCAVILRARPTRRALEFALLPPDNATGNFTKVVQRVAVKIVIDDADGLGDRLRPGLSVVARVNARDHRR